MKKKLKKKRILIFTIIIMSILILITFLYTKFHGICLFINIDLNGKSNITLNLNEKYKELGAKAKYKDIDITKLIKITGKVNNKKIGKYTITYTVKYKMASKSIKRIINTVDKEKPIIKFDSEEVTSYLGEEYKDSGVTASDNYDGDLTKKIVTKHNIDINKLGDYEVTYTVKDSSGNEAKASRKVKIVEKPKMLSENGGIAVLNYHFFYDDAIGESCNEGNCLKTSTFKEQLNYLRDNNFKTLTMQEFVDWMYGKIQIPEKSVLITVDDGAMGTGAHNGNKLIPILEEYKMHATLFLITGWWDINNYRSKYLDVESHTHDMHNGGMCEGVSRGAQMLCSTNEQVLNDLRTSISVTGSSNAFCFPLYAYDDNAINLVKEAGFKTAFIGGGYKVTQNTDKYHVPRYQIHHDTSLTTFINMVN